MLPRSVLEAVVTWLVNTHLRHVLEITDPAAQLSVCPGSGRITLAKVRLKGAAVRQLVPGLEVRGGEVGLLQLSLPPASLGSDPLVLVIEDVNIVLGPSSSQRTEAENLVCLNVSIDVNTSFF